jgi:tetratricopeptide (TPR) repeat protein
MKRGLATSIVIIVAVLIYSFILFRLPAFFLVKYFHAAELYLTGKLTAERILDFSPLYFYLNVLLHKLHLSLTVMLWLHIACTAASAVFLYFLLLRFFKPVYAIIGVTAFMLERSLIVYTGTFEPEPFALLFIVTATYFLSLNSTRSALLAGICFGLGILTRPNFVPVLAAVPFYYKLNASESRWLKNTRAVLVPALVCLFGLWIRNSASTGYFVPYVMNAGTVFYEGNNPNSWGMSSIYPPLLNDLSNDFSKQPDYHHQLYRDFARRITGRSLTVPEVNSYWSQKAIHFLFDHPKRTVNLLLTKVLHFFHNYEWHDLVTARSIEKNLQQHMINTPFAAISALALIGLLVLSSQWKRFLIFYAVLACQFIFMIAIYVSARQRVSILFLLIFFACAALQYMFTTKRRALLLLIAVLLLIPLQMKTDLMREEDHLWENMRSSNQHLSQAYRLRNQGRFVEAGKSSIVSLAYAPWLIDSRRPANVVLPGTSFAKPAIKYSTTSNFAAEFDQGVLLLEAGEYHQAERIFIHLKEAKYQLKRDDYQSSELNFYLAQCALRTGQKKKAIELLEKGLGTSPGDPSSLAYLCALTGKAAYQEQLVRYFDEIDAAFFLGMAYLNAGDYQRAVENFKYVTTKLPEYRKGFIYLAAAEASNGDYAGATSSYKKGMMLASDPVLLEEQILLAFQEAANQQRTAMTYYSHGFVLRQFGHFDEAMQQQKKALALDPGNKAIQQELVTLKRAIAGLENITKDTVQ